MDGRTKAAEYFQYRCGVRGYYPGNVHHSFSPCLTDLPVVLAEQFQEGWISDRWIIFLVSGAGGDRVVDVGLVIDQLGVCSYPKP